MKHLGKRAIAALLALIFVVGLLPTAAFATDDTGAEVEQVHTHVWGDWLTTAEPSCTEAGESMRVCSECGETETAPIPALGHSWGEWTELSAADCTGNGSHEHTCMVCGETVSEVIPAWGHAWGEWTVTAEPDCTTAGSREHTCATCGETASEIIAALGHTWGEWTVTADPNCTEAGSREHTCATCGETASEAIPALGHTWGEWTELTEPNCTEEGSHEHTCTVCGVTAVEPIPALGHTWGEWTELTPPTCTEEGSHEHTCSVCGVTETEAVDALGHDWDEWVITKEPTCEDKGEQEHVCKVCGEKETEEVEAKGHDWTEDNGVDLVKCKVCGLLKLIADGGSFDLEFDDDWWMIAGDPEADVEDYTTWDYMFRDMVLTGVWADDLLTIAQTQMGYHESVANFALSTHSGRNGYTRYGAWYGIPYGDWCAMFISFCMSYAGISSEDMPYDSGCAHWVETLNEIGRFGWNGSYDPKPGDVIFYDDGDGLADHVGIVHWIDAYSGTIHTIEGNLYDRVSYREVSRYDNTILGYGILPENPEQADAGEAAPERVEKTIFGQAGDRTVTVSGLLPADAELSVVAIPLGAAEEILSAQTGEALSDRKVLVAFDVSILSGGKKYDLEEYGDSVKVTVSNMDEKVTEVMHVKIDVTDGNGGLDMSALNAAMTQKQDSETLTVGAEGGEVFFDLTSCSTVLLMGENESLTPEQIRAEIKAHADASYTPQSDGSYAVPVITLNLSKGEDFPETLMAGQLLTYSLTYQFNNAETWSRGYSGPLPLWDYYKNNTLQIKLPAGLLLTENGLGNLKGRSPDNDDINSPHIYTLNLPDQLPSASTTWNNFTFTVFIANNGTENAINDYDLPDDMISLSTTIDVLEKYNPNDPHLVGTYTQTIKATSDDMHTVSSDVWFVKKDNLSAKLSSDQKKAVFTWDVGVGLLANNDLLVTENDYGREGRAKVDTLKLQDTFQMLLDKLNGDPKSNVTGEATTFTIQKYNGTSLGDAVPLTAGQDVIIWGTGENAKLKMNHGIWIDSNGQVGPDGVSRLDTDTPTYTKYLVTVEVPVKDPDWINKFPALKGYNLEGTNTATVDATYVGNEKYTHSQEPQSSTPEKKIVELPHTEPAQLIISKQFTDYKGNTYNYDATNSVGKQLYGEITYTIKADATFSIYEKKNNSYSEKEGFTGRNTYTLKAGESYYLIPGTAYTVTENLTEPQTHAMKQTGTISFAKTPNPGEKWQPQFTNQETAGDVVINKKDDSGRPLINAGFTVYTDSTCSTEVKAQSKTDAQGNVKFERLPYGTYYIKETAVPDGHTVEGNGWTVTVSDETIDANQTVTKEIINKVTASRLELTKYVGNANGTTPTDIPMTSTAGSGYGGKFTLQRKSETYPTWTDVTGFVEEVDAHGQIAGRADAFDNNGKPYTYRFVETIPSGYYDPVTLATDKSYSDEFTLLDGNGHARPLTDPVKVSMYNRRLLDVTVDKNFYDIGTDGKATSVYPHYTNVTLYQLVGETLTAVGAAQQVGRTDASTTVQAKWENLKAFDASGNKITYLVKEDEVAGYKLSWSNLTKRTIGNVDYFEIKFSDTSYSSSTQLANYEQVIPARMYKRNWASIGSVILGSTFSVYTDEACTQYATNAKAAGDLAKGAQLKDIPIPSGGIVFFLEPGVKYYFKETTIPEHTHWIAYQNQNKNNTISYNSAAGQTKAAPGYIDMSGLTVTGTTSVRTASVFNQYDPIVKIKKTSSTDTANNPSHIGGAVFMVYTKNAAGKYEPFPADAPYTINATNQAVAGTYLVPGTTYYFAETKTPDGYMDPNEYFALYQELDEKYIQGETTDGKTMTFYPVEAKNGTSTAGTENVMSVPFKNIPNAGSLKVVKKVDGVVATNKSFPITLSNDNGTDSITLSTGSDGSVTFTGLPVYKTDGSKITYTVSEELTGDLAKTYYKVSDGQTAELELNTTVDKDKSGETLVVENATRINYSASKYSRKTWGFLGVYTPMSGATIGLFRHDDENNKWVLVPSSELAGTNTVNPVVSDAAGNVKFTGLKRGVEYKMVELASSDPTLFPYNETATPNSFLEFPPQGAATTEIPDSELNSYNTVTLSASTTSTNTDKVEFPLTQQRLINANHWVQFHITKWRYHDELPASADANYSPSRAEGDEPWDNAVFRLYRVEMPADKTTVGYPDTGFGESGPKWEEIGTYTSGTLYSFDGTRLSGQFMTDVDEGINERYVYMLVEINPGPGGIAQDPDFEYTFYHAQGTGYSASVSGATTRDQTYEIDTVNDDDIVNDKPQGSGGDVIYLASIRLAKWRNSYDEETGELTNDFQPLPGAKFVIELPGAGEGGKDLTLSSMTVGLDANMPHNPGVTPPSVAQSGTMQLIPTKHTAEDGTVTYTYKLIDFESQKEISNNLQAEPFTFTYDGVEYSGFRVLVHVRETYAPDGFAYITEGYPMWLCFANIRRSGAGISWVFNDAYYQRSATPADAPLAENQQGNSLFITNADDQGIPMAYHEGPAPLRIVDYPSYNTIVSVHKYGYAPTAATIDLRAAQLDLLAKEDIDRTPLGGVTMILQKKQASGWKDWDYKNDKEATQQADAEFVTDGDGSFRFPKGLPEGVYRIWETDIGSANGLYEMAYPNETHARVFEVTKASLSLSLYNPKKISLVITKKDMEGNLLSGVDFKLGSLDPTKAENGVYTFSNIPSGTYKLTETKAGYSSEYLAAYLKSISGTGEHLENLAGDGCLLGYEYDYTPVGEFVEAVLKKISPASLVDGKASLALEIRNPRKVQVQLTKIEEKNKDTDADVTIGNATFVVYRKLFDKLDGAYEVKIPDAAFTATTTSNVTTAFRNAGWTRYDSNSRTYNTANSGANKGKIILTDLEPGVYVFFETAAGNNYTLIKDKDGKNIFYTAVATGGIPFESVEIKPSTATIIKSSDGTTEREITVAASGKGYGTADAPIVGVTAENRKKINLTATKEVKSGDLPKGNWSVTFEVYTGTMGSDGKLTDAKKFATLSLTQRTNQTIAENITFLAVGGGRAQFAIGTTYYLKEVITAPTENFAIDEVLIGNATTPVTPTAEGYYPFTVTTSTSFNIRVINDLLKGKVTFKKVDKDNPDKVEPLTGAEFKVCWKDGEVWKPVDGAEVKMDEANPGFYVADIPLVSKDERTYGIFETKAPDDGYLLQPDVPLEVKLDLAHNVKSTNLRFENSKGSLITVEKFNTVHDAASHAHVADGHAEFTFYHWVPGVDGAPGAWDKDNAVTVSVKDGKASYLVVPGETYGIVESSYNSDYYSGLESMYQGDTKLGPEEELVDGKPIFAITTDKNDPTNITLQAYNIPYSKPIIEKRDVGNYAGTKENTKVKAKMDYSIFELSTDTESPDYLAAKPTRAQVEEYLSSHTALITGTTETYDDTRLVNGTSDEWTSGDLAKRYDPAKTYLLVETSVGNKDSDAYDTLRKDDPRVTWYKVIQPGETGPYYLENVYGNASVTLEKTVIEAAEGATDNDVKNGAVKSLLTGDRKLVFQITPTVSGKNQMLTEFVVKENGITPTPEVSGFRYAFTKIVVGEPTHDASVLGLTTPPAIKATVTFLAADDSELGTATVTNYSVGNTITNIPDGTAKFTISYSSDEVVSRTQGVFDKTYCLGEQFRVQPTMVYAKALQQDNGTFGHGVKPINKLTNKAAVHMEYEKWNATGTKLTPVKADPTDTAVVNVGTIDIPKVLISKEASSSAVSFGSQDSVEVTYMITVKNADDSVSNFMNPVVMDILPTGATYVTKSANIVNSSRFDLTERVMIGGSSISSGPEQISEADTAVVFHLTDKEGSTEQGLKPGEELTISFKAKVSTTAALFRSILQNDAYLSSNTQSYYTESNPYGYSFTDDSGQPGLMLKPAAKIRGETEADRKDAARRENSMEENEDFNEDFAINSKFVWIGSSAKQNITDLTVIKPVKAVYGDRDPGFHDTGIGYASRTNSNNPKPDGQDFQRGSVKWRLSLYNGYTQKTALEKLAFGDVVPKPGDGRETIWENIMNSVLLVVNNSVDLKLTDDYTVYYYEGATSGAAAAVNAALLDRTLLTEANGWKPSTDYPAPSTAPENIEARSKITAFIVVMNDDIKLVKNTSMILTYLTDVVDVWDNETFNENYAFTNANNKFSVSFPFDGNMAVLNSNTVTVTLMDQPVEIQGDLWVDEDQDGVQGATNRRIYDDYAIVQLLKGATSFSITDERTYSEGTKTNDSGNMSQWDGGESIKHFRFDELGAATIRNVADLYGTPPQRLNPVALWGDDSYNYTLNAKIDLTNEQLSMFRISPLGPTHYQSDNPEVIGPDTFKQSTNFLDNNFEGSGQNYSTYPFFIPYSTTVDQSKDIGVMFFRNLEITKLAADNPGTVVKGAVFSIYGPFDDSTLGAGHTHSVGDGSVLKFIKTGDGEYTLDPKGTVTRLETGTNGKLVIKELNWWKEYDIKEVQAAPGYTLDSITATGDASEYTQISAVSNNTFTLKVPGTRKINKTDKVTVTNARDVDVTLKVYKLLETWPDDDSEFKFNFELRLKTVPYGTEAMNKAALDADPLQTKEVTVKANSLKDKPNPGDNPGKGGALGIFDAVKVYGAGTYVFEIKEQQTDSFHGTLDPATKTATVMVAWSDADNALKVTGIEYSEWWTDGDNTAVKFTNVYKPEPAKIKIPVTKTLAGDTPAKELTFDFILAANNKEPMPAAGGEKRSITVTPTKPTDSAEFGEIQFTLPGTYVYKVTEKAGTDTHLTYDDKEYTVTVTVVDGTGDLAGSLVASYTVSPAAGEDGKTVLFTNTYKPDPVELAIPVKKVVSGGTKAAKDETFTFTIAPDPIVSDPNNPPPLPTDHTVTVNVEAGKNVAESTFGAIKYTKAGTYAYIVREKRGSNTHYSYDMSFWRVTVEVKDTEDEKLMVTKYTVQKTLVTADATATGTIEEPQDPKSISADALKAMHDSSNICKPTSDEIKVVFTNPYTPEPVKLKIPVKKLVTLTTGSKEPDAVFTFDLEAKDGAPMPVVNDQTVTKDTVVFHWPADKDKTIEFHEITFREAGTFKYTVTEQEPNPRIPGVTYDTTPKNVTVTVTVGADDKLIVHYTVEGVTGEDKPVEITNTFDEPKVDVEVEKIWEDDDDQDAIRPEKITVTLKRSYTKTDGTEVKDEVVTFAQGDTNKNPVDITKTIKVVGGKDVEAWEYKWENLPKYYDMTQLITYSVTEAKIQAPPGFQHGYADTYEVEPTNPTPETTKFSIKITNTHEPERIDFQFTKVGEDVPVEGSTATTSTYSPLAGVEFTLYTDEACKTIATKPGTDGNPVNLVAVSDDHGVVKFEKLPMYKFTTDADGNETKTPMVYYMKETDLGANKDIYWDNSTIYKLEVVPKTATGAPAKIVMTEVEAIPEPVIAGGDGTGSTPTGDGSTPTGTGSTPTGDGSTPTGDGSTPTGNGSANTGDNTAAAEKPEPIRTGKLVSTTVDGKVAYTIQNDLVKYKVKLLKKDEKDKTPLANAEFALYHKGDLVEATPAQGQTTADPKWVPAEGKTPVKTGIKTDAKGEAELGWISRDGKLWLLPGEYELLETKAPDGYFPIEDPISIKIEKGKASYQQPGADKATELTLENVASFTVEVTNKPKYGDLKIIKYLPVYEMSEEATFIFDVVGKDDDGKVVYTNVGVLTLTTEGSKFTVLQHIPDGAHITVTERYTGSHYELDSAAEQTTTIVANRTVSVNFTNTYNYEDNGGHGLANVFKPNTNGGWTHDGVTTRTSTPADQPLEDYTPEAASPANPQAEPVAEED